MNWEQLLSDARWGSSHQSTAAPQKHRSNYDRDYGRILFSSAFRRLQDKTQVFPLGRNDYVRTRLTHSLEVAHVGSSLGMLVGEWLAGKDALPAHIIPSDLATIVSTACLTISGILRSAIPGRMPLRRPCPGMGSHTRLKGTRRDSAS